MDDSRGVQHSWNPDETRHGHADSHKTRAERTGMDGGGTHPRHSRLVNTHHCRQGGEKAPRTACQGHSAPCGKRAPPRVLSLTACCRHKTQFLQQCNDPRVLQPPCKLDGAGSTTLPVRATVQGESLPWQTGGAQRVRRVFPAGVQRRGLTGRPRWVPGQRGTARASGCNWRTRRWRRRLRRMRGRGQAGCRHGGV
jgi:hypothetical protein